MSVRKYQPEGSAADEQLARSGVHVSRETAKEVRQKLKSNLNDFESRLLLLGRGLWGHSGSYEQHLLWLIENHPKRLIHNDIHLSNTDATYQKARRSWLRQVRLNPNDVTILCHAAEFFVPLACQDAAKLLERATELDMCNDDIPCQLSSVYRLMVGHFSPRKNKILAHQAVEILKVAIERYAIPCEEDSYLQPYFSMVISQIADTALACRLLEDAKDLGQMLLDHQKINMSRLGALAEHPSAVYKLSTYRAHAIFGKAALAAGNVELAKEHLALMMHVPDGWYGDYSLADQLLKAGESEIVEEFIEHCRESWNRDFQRSYDKKDAESRIKWLSKCLKEIRRR